MTKNEYVEQEIILRERMWGFIAGTAGAIFFLILIPLDYYYTPENFKYFRIGRISIAVFLIISSVALLKWANVFWLRFIFFWEITASALFISYMIYNTGGLHSNYQLGLILLIACSIAYVPSPPLNHMINSFSILSIYATSLYLFNPFVVKEFVAIMVLFVSALVALNLVRYLHRVSMMNEIGQKFELEENRVKLEDYSNNLKEMVREKSQKLIQSKKTEALGTLASGLVHDFNNILSSIKGFSDSILYKKDVPVDLKDDVNIIEGEIAKGTKLINSLMSFGREIELNPESVDINKMIEEFSRRILKIFPDGFNIDLELGDVPNINVDKDQLDQVLTNLISNARDSMPNGGTITISTLEVDKDKVPSSDDIKISERYVHISITDTGQGIHEDAIGKIFDPFYTTKEMGKGAGLGLAMAYGTIKKHEGHINVESKVGEGTTFSIYLPVI